MGNIRSFQDLLNSNMVNTDILNSITVMNITVIDLLASLMLSLSIGILIFLVYKYTFQGIVYNNNFNVTLLGMTIITTVLIKAINMNLVLSLGMVGALSIVRFRSAIKDPKDIMFLFWAIAMGVTCGAGLYLLAIISAVFISIVMFISKLFNIKNTNFLLILRYNTNCHSEVLKVLNNYRNTVKTRVATGDVFEITTEIKLTRKNNQTGVIASFSEIDGVEYASLVQFDGDYAQ